MVLVCAPVVWDMLSMAGPVHPSRPGTCPDFPHHRTQVCSNVFFTSPVRGEGGAELLGVHLRKGGAFNPRNKQAVSTRPKMRSCVPEVRGHVGVNGSDLQMMRTRFVLKY